MTVKRERSSTPTTDALPSPSATTLPVKSIKSPKKAKAGPKKSATCSSNNTADIKFGIPEAHDHDDYELDSTSNMRQPKPHAGGGGKSRIQTDAKRYIAHYAAARGFQSIQSAEVQELVESTGLTAQQVRSQIADSRQNVRRQVDALIDTYLQ